MADEVLLAIHTSSGMSLPGLIFLRDVDIPFSEEHYEVAPASQPARRGFLAARENLPRISWSIRVFPQKFTVEMICMSTLLAFKRKGNCTLV